MAKSEQAQTFEAMMARIEELTEQLEDPRTGVEQSLALYEEAMKLVAQAQKRLGEIEHTFETIGKKYADESTSQLPTDDETKEQDEPRDAQNTLL